MTGTTAGRTVVAVFAHPDDETFSVGGTLAHYAEQGGRVVLITATRGELGEISDPALATPDNLGEVRERELRNACGRLGVTDVRFLDYRDSGMAGTEGNNDPRAFIQVDRDTVVRRLTALFRELRPDAVLTFDASGGYGHPDHIRAHEVATAAFDAAGDPTAYPDAGPAARLGRLFYTGFPRSLMQEMLRQARERGIDVGPMRDVDVETAGVPDEAIAVVMDVDAYVDRKLAAAREHRTQFGDVERMEQVPPEQRRQLAGREYFQLARGPRLPEPLPARDLFAGMNGNTA